MTQSRYGPWLARWTEEIWSGHSYEQALRVIRFLETHPEPFPSSGSNRSSSFGGGTQGGKPCGSPYRRIPQRLLDLGCGTGRAMEVFLDAGWEAEGLDESPDMLRLARTRLFRYLESGRGCLHAGRFQSGLPKGPFDLVTAFYNTLNHLVSVEDMALLARMIHSVLSPGGWCLADLNTNRGFAAWHGRETSRIEGWDIEVWRHFDPTTGRALLRASGSREGGSFEEKVENQAHDLNLISDCFRSAGFQDIAFAPPASPSDNLADPESMNRVLLKVRG